LRIIAIISRNYQLIAIKNSTEFDGKPSMCVPLPCLSIYGLAVVMTFDLLNSNYFAQNTSSISDYHDLMFRGGKCPK